MTARGNAASRLRLPRVVGIDRWRSGVGAEDAPGRYDTRKAKSQVHKIEGAFVSANPEPAASSRDSDRSTPEGAPR